MKTLTQRLPRLTKTEERRNYETVAERAGGVCEGCGVRPATDMHHRLYRGRGGRTTPDNLIHLCGGVGGMSGGNHSGCHGKAHTLLGEQLGWSVKSRNNPEQVPTFRLSDGKWRLNNTPIPASDATELMVLAGQLKTGL